MRESKVKKAKRAEEIIRLLKHYYPDSHCALNHRNAFELLIATMLSAQCTDDRVNLVTPELFRRFPTASALANADVQEVEQLIHSTGFFKNKAKNMLACAKTLVELYRGQVPDQLEKLIELAGVGRKTANVVLGVVFRIPSGIVVDTHVTRLSNRLGLVKGENAVILERDLMPLVPREHWIQFSHWLIDHGRKVCKARSPQCQVCFLSDLCPSSEAN